METAGLGIPDSFDPQPLMGGVANNIRPIVRPTRGKQLIDVDPSSCATM